MRDAAAEHVPRERLTVRADVVEEHGARIAFEDRRDGGKA